jgi:YidC/Oxa1 family membrane protein insertase
VLATGLAWWSSRRARRLLAEGPGTGRLSGLVGALPFLTVVMVAWLPLAGGLYLVTSAAWTALEQVVWRRPTPFANR